jgi:adenylate cyclase
MHYRPADPGLSLSAAAVMAPDDDPALRALLEGHIVFVGASAQGAGAMQATILGETVPRATVQAQIAEQILSRSFLQRDARTEKGEIGSFLLLGVIVVIVMGMGGPVWSALAGGTAGAVLLAASWYAFTVGGLLFDVTFALAGGVLAFAVMGVLKVAVIDRERRFLRGAFAPVVAPEMLAEITTKDRAALGLGGSIRHVTAMRCNIRDFPALAEASGSVALTGLVNQLFTDLGQEVRLQRGTIDRFMGEAMTAFWNAPLDQDDHPVRAATAALNLRSVLARFNAARTGQPQVALSIGLASGPACLGDLGSRDRFTYTAVGEVMTMVARIESAARYVGYDIIISAETGQRIQNFARLDAGFLLLRSQSTRSGAQILVGGPDLAGTQPFIDLRDSHFKLVQALRDNDADAIAQRLDECRRLAATVEPGLAGFYAVIEGRHDDYV